MAAENEPTIQPYQAFNATTDAKALRAAMKGFGTNEDAIIEILTKRSNQQRQVIYKAFRHQFGRDLIDDLKSELRGKFEDLIIALMEPSIYYLAKELYNAMAGLGCNCETMTEILCTRSNAEVKQIADAYEKKYNETLDEAIEKELSGDYKSLLTLILTGARDEESYSPEKAREQAETLYAAGEGKWGTDEEVFVVLLCHESLPQLRLIFREYDKLSKRTLIEAIEAEFSGKLKTAILTLVKIAMSKDIYYAEKLELAMKGLGTDDGTLMRIIVSRCEIDLGNIKKVYEQTYQKTLIEAVESETSGDYRKALVNLIQGYP